MTKMLFSGDWHQDAVTAGVPRFDEIEQHAKLVREVIVEEKIDIFTHLGDLHDPGSLLESLYSAMLIRTASNIRRSRDGVRQVWIPGNHDVVEIGSADPVTTLSPMREAAFAGAFGGSVLVNEDPSFDVVSGVGILSLPYVARSRIGESAWFLDQAFDGAAKNRAGHQLALVVVGHQTVPGATLGSESAEMARGGDRDFPFERVAALKPSAVVNGHYHTRQVVRACGLEIHFPGSPEAFTFGEITEARGCLIVEV